MHFSIIPLMFGIIKIVLQLKLEGKGSIKIT